MRNFTNCQQNFAEFLEIVYFSKILAKFYFQPHIHYVIPLNALNKNLYFLVSCIQILPCKISCRISYPPWGEACFVILHNVVCMPGTSDRLTLPEHLCLSYCLTRVYHMATIFCVYIHSHSCHCSVETCKLLRHTNC
jgi:hypothetical protein